MKIAIQLTNKCSKKCPWCYAQSNPEGTQEINYNELTGFILELSRLPNRPLLCLGGGEPFEYSKITQLIEFLEDSSYPYSLTSNLLKVNSTNCKIKNGWLWGSIHRPQETARVICALKSSGVPHVGVNILIMRGYLPAFSEMIDHLESEHIPYILTFFKTSGRGVSYPQERLQLQERREIVENLCAKYRHGVYTDSCQGLTGKMECHCGVDWFTITENKELRPNSFYPTGIYLKKLSLECFNETKKIIPCRVHVIK